MTIAGEYPNRFLNQTHRLTEHPFMNHRTLYAAARREIEAQGYLTSNTSAALRNRGVDPAEFERRVLDAA